MKSCKLFSFIFFILFLVLVSGCAPVKTKSAEQKQKELIQRNRIRKITEYYSSVFLGIKQNETTSEIKYYNNKGLLTQEISFSSDGQADLTIIYNYDTHDNLILSMAINKDSLVIFKETTSYDSNNNRKEHYHFLPDGAYKYRNMASYDNKNRMAELAWYWPSGFRSKNVYAYNMFNKISDTEYSELGKTSYQWQYSYDANDNLIEAIQYYPGNILTRKITYEYNNNKLVKQTNYQGESIEDLTTFDYNSQNLLSVKTEYSASGKITAVSRYSYD
jgi:hypothetical protein